MKLLRLSAILIALSLILSGCGNGGGESSDLTTVPSTQATQPSTQPSTEPSAPAEAVEHSITITNAAGKALSKVELRVYADSSLTDLIAAGKTDTDGVFTFKRIPSDGYVAVLSKVPTGYGVADMYELTGEKSHILLSSASVSQDELYAMRFRLGDAMPDFSLTDHDGTVYTLSELLRDKKAVVLNFWNLSCVPCKQEFPHIQQAYEKYSDQIEFLAINPMDSDGSVINQFVQEMGYTFPMFQVDFQWHEMFNVNAYPLTIVIDRYGNIALTHSGSVPDTETFENLFAYFSADDYSQEFYKSIQLLPKIGE